MSNKAKVISLSYLMGLLSIARGAQMATITAVTDPRLRKTDNPFKSVTKRSVVNVVVNFHYGNAVNNQRGREGEAQDFQPDPRKWGERLPGLPFVTHKGRVYLECKVQRSISHEYRNGRKRLSDEQVAPFLPTRNSSATHQGVEKEIILRDYAIDTIREIAIGGTRYVVNPRSRNVTVVEKVATYATA